MVKRYALFAYETYYPSGGWGDFVGSFDTLDEARAYLAADPRDAKGWEIPRDNREIIDLTTGQDVTPADL